MKSFCFPGNIEDDILKIDTELYYPRTEKFSNTMKYIEHQILTLSKSSGKMVLFSSSGTGAMDACVSSFLINKDFPLIINGGSFGKRWKDLCDYYNIPNMELNIKFGEDLDLEILNKTLEKYKNKWILLQHCETSSGILYNIEKISKICKSNNCKIILDSISSFLCDDLNLDEDNIDICVLSSQKGLNIFPGLSMIIFKKDFDYKTIQKNNFYFDIDYHLKDLERGQTPFTPSVQLISQLKKRLEKIEKIGIENYINKIKNFAEIFRKNIYEIGLKSINGNKSNCETSVLFSYNVKELIQHLNNKQIYVMPSYLKNMIRVSHTGCLDISNYNNLIKEFLLWDQMVKK